MTELECLLAFSKAGHKVSIPYGENCRYDFILDVEGKLLKIQCKTAHYVDENSFKIACASTRKNSKNIIRERYDKKQIDFFATYYNSQCYLIPVEECGIEKRIHFTLPKNGQKKGICLANWYLMERVLKRFSR